MELTLFALSLRRACRSRGVMCTLGGLDKVEHLCYNMYTENDRNSLPYGSENCGHDSFT